MEASRALVGQCLAELHGLINKKGALPRHETAKFIWHMIVKIRKLYFSFPNEISRWHDAKAMLKELVVWDKFKPEAFMPAMIENVTEEHAEKVLSRYHNFLNTGHVDTVHPAPDTLGQTDLVCFIDKPSGFTCEFGGDVTDVPKLSGLVHGATELLNGPSSRIQIHEYVAKRFNTEVARATQTWWKCAKPTIECTCQKCEKCCTYIAGLCHRLDCETSGVMVVAKTLSVFSELRTSMTRKSSSGAKKFYLAIVHGKILVPNDAKEGWGTINIPMKWETKDRKSVRWDDEHDDINNGLGRDDGGKNNALTYFRPLKYFSEQTLVQLQIVTGARHQIRFHCSALGHPLVGDVKYGAPFKDREWAGRVALHAYRVELYEPETGDYLKAVAPLPPDLLKILLQLAPSDNATELPGTIEEKPLWTREDHKELGSLFQKAERNNLFSCDRSGVVSPPVAPWHSPGPEASPSAISTPPPCRKDATAAMSPPAPWPKHPMSPPPPWPTPAALRRHG